MHLSRKHLLKEASSSGGYLPDPDTYQHVMLFISEWRVYHGHIYMFETLEKLDKGHAGEHEKLARKLGKWMGLEKFVDDMLETMPPTASPEDKARFKDVTEQIRIKNEKLRIPAERLLVVRFIENSEITISPGAMLDAVEVKGSTIKKEEGGEVYVFEMDADSRVLEVVPEREPRTCTQCGAPWEGHRRCSYCGSESF
jgi:hypothetical protein